MSWCPWRKVLSPVLEEPAVCCLLYTTDQQTLDLALVLDTTLAYITLAYNFHVGLTNMHTSNSRPSKFLGFTRDSDPVAP